MIIDKEKPQFNTAEESHNIPLSQPEEVDPARLLLPDDIGESAANARQEITRSHSVWRNMSGVIEDYLKSRETEIGKTIDRLIDKQEREREEILSGQSGDLETVKLGTRIKLQKFFFRTLGQLYRGTKKVLGVIPDTQKLIDNLGASEYLEKNSVGKNLIAALSVAGGVRSYSVEKGIIIDDERGDSGLKNIIRGVNNFLEKNESSRIWLQDVIRVVVNSKK